jgi:hypothetical protein
LIYFTFRDDTYVVSSAFTCLMIIGEFAAGVRILLEKGPSRHHVLEDQEIPEKYQKIIFYQKTEEARRRRREEPQGRHTHRGRSPTPGRAGLLCGHPGPLLPLPLRAFYHPQKPKSRGGSEIDTAASAEQKTPEREKLSGRQESAGEIPSRRGEIVAIVITIAPDFIRIIIIRGVARPQARPAMAWGVEANLFIDCSYSSYYLALFDTVVQSWPGALEYSSYATDHHHLHHQHLHLHHHHAIPL